MAVAMFVPLMVFALIFWARRSFTGRDLPVPTWSGVNYEMELPAQVGTARTRRDLWSSCW